MLSSGHPVGRRRERRVREARRGGGWPAWTGAARIESLNKQYGTRMITSEDTRRLKQRYDVRPLGDVTVRGRCQPVSTFEVPEMQERLEKVATQIAADRFAFAATLSPSDVAAFNKEGGLR